MDITENQRNRIKEILHDTSKRHRVILKVISNSPKNEQEWVRRIITTIQEELDVVFEILNKVKK